MSCARESIQVDREPTSRTTLRLNTLNTFSLCVVLVAVPSLAEQASEHTVHTITDNQISLLKLLV